MSQKGRERAEDGVGEGGKREGEVEVEGGGRVSTRYHMYCRTEGGSWLKRDILALDLRFFLAGACGAFAEVEVLDFFAGVS